MIQHESQILGEHEVNLDREFYHLTQEIQDWLTREIGPGEWNSQGSITEGCEWSITQLFGYTNIRFRHSQDTTAFVLKWL